MENKTEEKKDKILEYTNDFPSEEEERRLIALQQEAEINFQKKQKRNEIKKNIIKIAYIVIISFLIIATSIFIYYRNKNNNIKNNSVLATIPIDEEKGEIFFNDKDGIVDAQVVDDNKKDDDIDNKKGLIGESENFKIKDISIGGGSVVLAGEDENVPIKVTDVHTETMLSKDEKESKLLISWKTNKMAQSEVIYIKEGTGNFSQKKVKDIGYGFSHALIISKLEQATRYSFSVKAVDRFGNSAKSETFLAYTGSKPVSVFTMISNEFDNIFGWAVNKK